MIINSKQNKNRHMVREELLPWLQQIIFSQDIIQGILSWTKKSKDKHKVTIRPIIIKDTLCYQITDYQCTQAKHHNLTQLECIRYLEEQLNNFKQFYLYTAQADYHLLCGKNNQFTLLQQPPSKNTVSYTHNRKKNYILEEGVAIPFLVHLSVMNAQGKVYASKMDKFRQINRFLEMLEDVISHFDQLQTLKIIDFGCGKAYLTFAIYHFLKIIKGYEVQIVGLDLKSDVIVYCNELSKTLGYHADLKFIQGDICNYQTENPVDLIVALHACDTASDIAIAKAIQWQAKVVLCAPCCQKEALRQIKNDKLESLLKHGILKERFAALATDALRAALLEAVGYHTQLLEFISIEHTSKNILIRAVKQITNQSCQITTTQAWRDYLTLKNHLNINISLERFILDCCPH